MYIYIYLHNENESTYVYMYSIEIDSQTDPPGVLSLGLVLLSIRLYRPQTVGPLLYVHPT